MFKLQRLEITGFKSFADYTEIIFTGNGITAVVGPNGCGKSNVSESIAWVLGEQRAKALRGSEMKDVVFQGTKNRKPSGMAEVVLHFIRDEETLFFGDEEELGDIDEALHNFDEKAVQLEDFDASEQINEVGEAPEIDNLSGNSNDSNGANGFHSETAAAVEQMQTAPLAALQTSGAKSKSKRHWRARSYALDFAPGEAISVTRRLYLSGESEYLLNGKACRLRDIQDLFAGTGLSGAHYAIIEQGRIGQILSAKPADRRNLIEEAAGISKFRTRQRAAETRLESAKTNLSRISDIVSEIDKQANSLRRQAAKTRRYKVLREDFRVLLKKLFTAEGLQLSQTAAELELKLTESAKIERRLFDEVAEQDEAFRRATGEARAAEEALAEMRGRHAESALERDRASREYRYQTEQISSLESRAAILKGEIESTEQRLELLKNEHEKLRGDEKNDRAEAEKNELALRETESKYREKTGELHKIEAEIEKERGDLMRHTAAVERFGEIRRQMENNLERLKERAEGLKRESIRAEENRAEHRIEAENLAEKVKSEKAKLEKLHQEKLTITKAATERREVLRGEKDRLKNLQNEFARKKNRRETLQELEEKRAVYAPQVQKIFAAEAKIGVKFAGILADKLTVDERAEKAVENLFGNHLQAILVENEDDARKTIDYLNENNVGRISVLVQDSNLKIQDSEAKSDDSRYENRIENLLGVSADFVAILERVFPREMAALLIEKLANAPSSNNGDGGEIYVDLAGDLLIGERLFVGGKANANEKNNSLLAFKRELRELEQAALKLAAEIEAAEAKTEKARKDLAENEEKIVDLQSLIVKNERDLLGLEIREKTVRQEIERAERHQKVVADETNQIEKELAQLTQKQTEAQNNAQKAEAARAEAAQKLENIGKKLSEARIAAAAENAVLNEKRTAAATSGERRRAAQTALRRVETEEKELETRLARQKMEIFETDGKRKMLAKSLAEINQKIASADREQSEEQNSLSEAAANLKTARERADETSRTLADLNKKSAEARNERAAFEIRQTETLTKLRGVTEKCAHELNVPLGELIEKEEIEADFDLGAARKEAEDLREKIENFGAINMLALEELAETEERLTFLTAQRQDIIDSIAAAEAALREIKERSREKFKAAFAAINANFIEFFQELFGGGRGEMTLLEADDVLEAGIEIVAQPPGKRLQNILLLSGGEKAMTAIALVMGIFKYRPAPFCLLDEVDAPLDDANVGRFVNKIADMSEKTQFIVITHNKRTMEAARALYGVTMQEAGVSKIVSVKFE